MATLKPVQGENKHYVFYRSHDEDRERVYEMWVEFIPAGQSLK